MYLFFIANLLKRGLQRAYLIIIMIYSRRLSMYVSNSNNNAFRHFLPVNPERRDKFVAGEVYIIITYTHPYVIINVKVKEFFFQCDI